jgi:hypothetical protein
VKMRYIRTRHYYYYVKIIMIFIYFRSVSFIFATGAMAFILLAMCYLLIDVYGIWNGAPFIYPGMYITSHKPMHNS